MPALAPTANPTALNRHSQTGLTRSLAVILHEEFGVPFAFYAVPGGMSVPVGEEVGKHPPDFTPEQMELVATTANARVTVRTDGRYQVLLPLREAGQVTLLGVGTLSGFASSRSAVGEECLRLQKWAQSVCDRIALTTKRAVNRRDVQEPGRIGSLPWDAIAGLQNLLQNLHIHKNPSKQQDRILRTARDVLQVQAVMWVPRRPEADVALSGNAGMSPWDCRQLANRVAKSPELDQAGFLICNDVSEKSWGPCFSNIANLIALTFEEQGSAGILIAINKLPASPPAGAGANRSGHTIDLDPARTPPPRETHEAVFRPGHATALAAFASLRSMHAHASLRYLDLKGLVVGLTRSLTAAIDAKDAYTYGHSERVARVAVELARELELQDDEIRDAYLAGLLHDVGKIGICEAVLSKRGPLDSTEMDHMKQHVVIGCTILADLHAIRHLIPGVRSHHERYDGRGYPDGLKGDEIPLLARILAVADAYDAMNTSRPYRSGMQPERIEEILRSGAGSQWDTRVVDAYFRCREKVIAVRQTGVGESLRQALSCAVRPA